LTPKKGKTGIITDVFTGQTIVILQNRKHKPLIMKFFYKLSFPLITLLVLSGYQGKAQLALGDIAFTGYNSNGSSDDFTFMILRTGGLPASTVINFTDCGWQTGVACGGNGFTASNGTTETDISWTSPASILAYGTQIRIAGLTASQGSVSGTAINLSGTGDQIFAFTGARTAPNLIAGIHANLDGGTSATNWDGASGTTQSARPACLTNGTYALYFPGIPVGTELDNWAHKCNILISTAQATALTQINNAANWDGQDAVAFSIPRTCPLPVRLISFQAQNNINDVTAKWQVSNEVNFSHYDVERSFDNQKFEKIASVNAVNNNASGISDYSYSDKESLKNSASIIYYRLKMNDIDGKFSYSEIVSIRNKKGESLIIDNLVNPLKDKVSFTLSTKTAGRAEIQLTDASGKIVANRSIQTTAGANTINMPETIALTQGIYFLRVVTATGSTTVRLIK
jgi:hypothetical protein